MTRINKAQAVQLVGAQEVQRIVDQNDASLLATGAKLSARRVGCIVRFQVHGYAADGHDERDALAAIGVEMK